MAMARFSAGDEHPGQWDTAGSHPRCFPGISWVMTKIVPWISSPQGSSAILWPQSASGAGGHNPERFSTVAHLSCRNPVLSGVLNPTEAV